MIFEFIFGMFFTIIGTVAMDKLVKKTIKEFNIGQSTDNTREAN